MERGRCSLWAGIRIGVGVKGDYGGMARWHYRAGMPVAVTRVLVARFREGSQETEDRRQKGRVIGVLVETRPVLNCALRNVALSGRYVGGDKRRLARRLNREVTTIARVVVEPRFRGIGVAGALVRRALSTARTDYVEALSSMGRECGFLERAGMRRFDRPMPMESVRLLAALSREGLRAWDLWGMRPRAVTGFLGRELMRFARVPAGFQHQGHQDTRNTKVYEKKLARALEEARRRVGSWPAYFVWRRRGARVPAVARPLAVGRMAEALVVFMGSEEKRLVVEGLGRVDPDLGRALVRVCGQLATNEHE